ncbi:hypothetical protein SAMN04487820_102137 [Actinopolyspora mzabensis]|uniref:Uncharacterized protein n=1 Tax=Actinopolyspora mzabensis TaxID=995066 RepID=A0A1G8WNF3_ACTMZ|nr:hypothetical protein SAMN04487820_102137 [Actinopolyspora mzabensis]
MGDAAFGGVDTEKAPVDHTTGKHRPASRRGPPNESAARDTVVAPPAPTTAPEGAQALRPEATHLLIAYWTSAIRASLVEA